MDTSETYTKMQQGLPEKPIPHTAVSYLAGLIDGEGTISIRRKVGNHFNIELYITNSNKPMLEWVVKVFDGKIYTYTRKGDTTRLPQHKWHLHGKQAEDILRLVLPYLIIKGEHARLAIEFRERMNRDTSWHREFANKVKSIQKSNTYSEPKHQITQDQLQEMIGDYKEARDYIWGIGSNLDEQPYLFKELFSVIYIESFVSMEQLWLAFVMKEKYNKTWDKENWIKAEQNKRAK